MKYATAGVTTRDWVAATKKMKISANIRSYSQGGTTEHRPTRALHAKEKFAEYLDQAAVNS